MSEVEQHAGDAAWQDPPSWQTPMVSGGVFDRFAALVCAALGVPAAVITLVETDRQVFTGAVGLPDHEDDVAVLAVRTPPA